MKDMDRLVEILAQKIRKQVRIRIIGDYDVDGVTSSHLFLMALRRVGAKWTWLFHTGYRTDMG